MLVHVYVRIFLVYYLLDRLKLLMYRRLTFKQLVEETMRLGNLSPLFSELGKGMLITKVKVHFFLISLLRDDGNLSREAYSLRVDEALDRIQNTQRMESCKLAKAHSYRITDPKNYEDALCFDPDRWNVSGNIICTSWKLPVSKCIFIKF